MVKGGNRQPFNRDKLIARTYRACEKGRLADQIEQLVGVIERELREHYDRE